MIGKKEKLSDVYAKGAFSPYLTSIGPFKDVYPSISKLNVEVRQSSTLTGSTPWVYSESDVPPFIDCRNELCEGGGVYLYSVISQMVAGKETDGEKSVKCDGKESRGRKQYVPCFNLFRIKVHIEYKDEQSL